MNPRTPTFTGAAIVHGLWALGAAMIMSGCGSSFRPVSYYPPAARSVISPLPARAPGRSQTVRTSWYGPGFDGHRTASGQVFNENGLTAASRTLPLGSRVRVSNPSSGRSVVVTVTDRGPYVRGRSLDLSRAAASRIGIIHKGTAKVKVTRLKKKSASAPGS